MTTDIQINAAIALLTARGFSVSHPQADEWTSPIDLYRSHGAGTLAQFHDRLHHPRAPHYQRRVGSSGRMTMLRPTPALIAFLRLPSQPGSRLK
tara:strand:- start:717 stop:998 length:282 start_codon:yes stop_codon:yes gene_type:complete